MVRDQLDQLSDAVHALHAQVAALRITATEDLPGDPAESPALADLIGDACDTVAGWLEAAQRTLTQATGADLLAAARAALSAHEHLCRTREQVSALMTWERFTQLYALAERRGEWPAWVWIFGAQLEQLQQSLAEAERAVLAVWSALSDHLAHGVLVRATNIGHLSLPLRPDQGGREGTAELPATPPHLPPKEVSRGSQS